MAHDAEAEADVKVEQEMESFLIDSFARMNGIVMNMIQQKKGAGGDHTLEPKVANLVGKMLDEFRFEGTADLLDKHIGMDPFAIDLDDVRREFEATIGEAAEMDDDESAAPIEEHLVANVVPGEGESEEPAAHDDDMPAIEVVDDVEDERPAAPAAAAPTPAAAMPAASGAESDPEAVDSGRARPTFSAPRRRVQVLARAPRVATRAPSWSASRKR